MIRKTVPIWIAAILLGIAGTALAMALVNAYTPIRIPLPSVPVLTMHKVVRFDEPFLLRKGGIATVEGTDISIRLTAFVNSPCPKNALCLWIGQAVQFQYQSGNNVEDVTWITGTPPKEVAIDILVTKTDYTTYAIVVLKQTDAGILQGNLTIGPACPAERSDQPCTIPASAYTSRTIVLYQADGKTEFVRTSPNEQGRFSFKVPQGKYVVDIPLTGMESGKNLPMPVAVVKGAVVEVTLGIDTGIR